MNLRFVRENLMDAARHLNRKHADEAHRAAIESLIAAVHELAGVCVTEHRIREIVREEISKEKP